MPQVIWWLDGPIIRCSYCGFMMLPAFDSSRFVQTRQHYQMSHGAEWGLRASMTLFVLIDGATAAGSCSIDSGWDPVAVESRAQNTDVLCGRSGD